MAAGCCHGGAPGCPDPPGWSGEGVLSVALGGGVFPQHAEGTVTERGVWLSPACEEAMLHWTFVRSSNLENQPPRGIWSDTPAPVAAPPCAAGHRPSTHCLVGGLFPPARLPHSQAEGVLHAGLQALPGEGDRAAPTGPEGQRTPSCLTLQPTTGGSETPNLLQSRASPGGLLGRPPPCWDQAHQVLSHQVGPRALLSSLAQRSH